MTSGRDASGGRYADGPLHLGRAGRTSRPPILERPPLRPTIVLALLVAGLLLSGCELRLASDVVVEADGAGTFELQVALDDELHELLVDAGLDPLLGVEELGAAAPDWSVDALDTGGDGLRLSLSTAFDGPDEFARITDGLHATLDDVDGQLWERLRLDTDGDEVALTGVAGLLIPQFPGADGVAFDEDDLAALIEQRGDEFVRYELRVTLPGEVVSHDADEVAGSTLVWQLPVGESRSVAATSQLAVAATPLVLVAVGLVVAAGVAAVVYVVRSRRAAARRQGRRSTISS